MLKVNDQIIERPQYMLMRVTLAIHINNLERAVDSTVRPTLISLWPRAQLLEANTCYDYTSQISYIQAKAVYISATSSSATTDANVATAQTAASRLLSGCFCLCCLCLPVASTKAGVFRHQSRMRNFSWYVISIGTEFIYDLDWYEISESINYL